MKIKKFEEMGAIELDVMKEIGSIGTGNAATALSQVLSESIKMSIPSVMILDYDQAIRLLGEYEEIIAAILVKMGGDMDGIMQFLLKMDFIQETLKRLLNEEVNDYQALNEMDVSALQEIGNIMISSYINAISKMTGMDIDLSVPAITVDMLGGIMSVPITEFGYKTDKLMIITGKFILGDREIPNYLLLMPDISSLNRLMQRLGVDTND